MTRSLQLLGLAIILVACAPETRSNPPTHAKQPPSVPNVPALWNLDAPLSSRHAPHCPADNVTAEEIAFLRNDVEFTFIVEVDAAGKVREVKLAQTRAPEHHLRLLNHAQKCLASVTFAEPPHQPYEMKTIVKFSAQKRSWPE